jgi:dTDP-4-amino-4,6-dideoxygalactose transaminase
MVKDIGSDFNINLGLFFSRKRKNIPKKAILLASGNDCISYILKELKPKTNVLLPSYLCPSMLLPFKKQKINFSFYKVNKKLEIDLTDLQRKIKKEKPSAILIIHYFGFIQPQIGKISELCKKNKIKLIEDHVQSFLSKPKLKGDYMFNSYRKWLPTPDGAFLIKKSDNRIKINKSPKKYTSTRLKAGLLKNIKFLKETWRPLFVEAEENLINEYKRPARMSKVSRSILNKIDLKKITSKRRRNYTYLAKHLKPLYPTPGKEICPIGFPITFKSKEERNTIRKKLIENKIYPPIHWALPKEIKVKESIELSNRIMTIPIDQRYNIKDMKRVVKCIKF